MTLETPIRSLLQYAHQIEFWRSLNPGLSIAETWASPPQPIALDPDLQADRISDLSHQGYFQIEPVLPEMDLFRMAAGIEVLYENQIPELFAFVYDEFWQIHQSLRPLLTAFLGSEYRQLPAFWAWYLDAKTDHAGWERHRDRSQPTLRPDGMPNIMTIWIPLTDASPLNGCMYVLPAHLDPNYPDNLKSCEIDNVRDIRALPAAMGSVLGWTHSLLHWGARSSPKAPCPRISISCEFQRGDVDPYETPLLPSQFMPSFEQRLRLVGHQIRKYKHMFSHPEELLELATHLLNTPLRLDCQGESST